MNSLNEVVENPKCLNEMLHESQTPERHYGSPYQKSTRVVDSFNLTIYDTDFFYTDLQRLCPHGKYLTTRLILNTMRFHN